MPTLDAWLARQETVHVRSVDLGLDRISKVARALALGKPAPVVITVAGTNGKGSVVALLERLILAADLTVGTFTSPHLFRYNERIRINGREVTDAQLIAAFERIERVRGETSLTFFEFNALAAFLILQDTSVEVAVLEVGLGGRLDAVNLIDADAAIICSIGIDHRDWLGDTLEDIGREKAGVFRRGAHAVLATADMPLSVYRRAAESGSRSLIAGRDYSWSEAHEEEPEGHAGSWTYKGFAAGGLPLSFTGLALPALEGAVQLRNACAALTALAALGLAGRLNSGTVSSALASARLAGRFDRIRNRSDRIEWIFDVAHNAPAAAVLAANLAALPQARTIAVGGVLSDKDVSAVVAALRGSVDEWIFCTLDGPRGLHASELAARVAESVSSPRLAASVAAGCAQAQELARAGDRIVVFGSFHTVGPAYEWLGYTEQRF